MITNKDKGLASAIFDKLSDITISVKGTNEDGSEVTRTYTIDKNNKTQEHNSPSLGSNPPRETPYEPKVLKNALEIIAEVIAKEVLNYLINNATVELTKRVDLLEQDYEVLMGILVGLGVAGQSAPSPVMNTSFIPVSNSHPANVAARAIAKGLETILGEIN